MAVLDPVYKYLNESINEKERVAQMREEREARPNYGGNNYHKEAAEIKGAGGVFVIISLAVGFLGLIIFSQVEPMIAVACVGQMFLFIGLSALLSQKLTFDNCALLLFPIIGAGMVFFPLDSLYRRKHDLPPLLTTNGIEAVAGICCLALGLAMIIVPFIRKAVMLKRCTLTVEATCIGLDSHLGSTSGTGTHRHRTRVYAPDWEYTVDGKIYNHLEEVYTNVGYPEIGSVHEIHVDPDDPVVIYRKNGGTVVVIIVGLIFALLGALMIYMMLIGK